MAVLDNEVGPDGFEVGPTGGQVGPQAFTITPPTIPEDVDTVYVVLTLHTEVLAKLER